MSLSESLLREDEEPPDDAAVSESRPLHHPVVSSTARVAASARVQRQFESHCVLRLCNAVDDENAVTAVEATRSTARRTDGVTARKTDGATTR